MSEVREEPEDMDTRDEMRTKEDMRPKDEMRSKEDMRTREETRTPDDVVRTNQEGGGCSGPGDVRGRRGGPTEMRPRGVEGDVWPQAHQYRARMMEIQSQFIDDPRGAVKQAEQLVDEAVDQMARAMHDHLKQMHQELEGDADTEKLRLMMRDLGQMFERLDMRRAA
jgi:hypothetical protein